MTFTDNVPDPVDCSIPVFSSEDWQMSFTERVILEGLLDHYCPRLLRDAPPRRTGTRPRGRAETVDGFGSTAVGEQWDEEDDLELLFELPAHSAVA